MKTGLDNLKTRLGNLRTRLGNPEATPNLAPSRWCYPEGMRQTRTNTPKFWYCSQQFGEFCLVLVL